MSKDNFEFSEKLQQKAKKDNVDIYKLLFKKNIISHVISYIIDSRYRRGVRLSNWIKNQAGHPEIIKIANKLRHSDDDDVTMQNILYYWQNGHGNLKYVGDKIVYGANEYWASIEEILENKRDDCDGFMTVIYLTALAAGISDSRLFCTCGNVVGGGHAYVTYIANNGVMYAIDGCYWTNRSIKLNNPYFQEKNYYNGKKEWFRFNSSGTYKLENK